jgi:ADP-heptose:LPS heptosyltransferase
MESKRNLVMSDKKYRILICKLASLGDCLVCTPVVKAIREKYPDAHITLMTSKPYQEVWEGNPNIDELKVTPPVTEHWDAGYTLLAYDTYIHTEVTTNHYDKVIRLNTLTFWGEYRRTGVDLAQHYAEMADVYPLPEGYGYDIYYDEFNARGEILHEFQVGKNPNIEDHDLEPFLKGTILIHRGGGWGLKVLPDHQWIDIVGELLAQTTYDVAFVGGPGEDIPAHLRKDLEELDWVGRIFFLDGKLSLQARHYWMKHAPLFLGADSGPMHLASAANCPSVVYYSVTSQYVGTPISDKFITVQSPGSCAAPCGLVVCRTHQLCSRLFDPQDIVQACTDLLSGTGTMKKFRDHRIGGVSTHHYYHGWEHLSVPFERPDLAAWKDQRPILEPNWRLNEV